MHSSWEIHDDAVKLTWCACELCNSAGPRLMTLVKNDREYTVELRNNCCNPGVGNELMSGEAANSHHRLSQRNHLRR